MIEHVLVPLVLAVAAVASSGSTAATQPRSSVAPRNDVRGDAIEGYTSEISVLPGGTVHFDVQTNPPELYRISI
jgi:hypothetical protein